jgi:hypothetical protein
MQVIGWQHAQTKLSRRTTTSLATKLGSRSGLCGRGKYLYPGIEPQNLHPDRSLVAIPPKLGRNLFRHSQRYIDLGVVTGIYFAFVLISRSAAAAAFTRLTLSLLLMALLTHNAVTEPPAPPVLRWRHAMRSSKLKVKRSVVSEVT